MQLSETVARDLGRARSKVEGIAFPVTRARQDFHREVGRMQVLFALIDQLEHAEESLPAMRKRVIHIETLAEDVLEKLAESIERIENVTTDLVSAYSELHTALDDTSTLREA